MQSFHIAVIAGDGVGVEVIPPAKRVLEKIGARHQIQFEFEDFDWGSDYYVRHGLMMPAGAIELPRPFDAILLCAGGPPAIPGHVSPNGRLLPIRRASGH